MARLSNLSPAQMATLIAPFGLAGIPPNDTNRMFKMCQRWAERIGLGKLTLEETLELLRSDDIALGTTTDTEELRQTAASWLLSSIQRHAGNGDLDRLFISCRDARCDICLKKENVITPADVLSMPAEMLLAAFGIDSHTDLTKF